jgi:hypothetical protein
MFSHVWSSARFKQWRAMMISIEGLLEDEQGSSMGEMLTVKFRQPSHEFTFGVDISFILYPLVLTPLVYQVHSCMSVLEFSVYAGFWCWKQDFRDKFIKHLVTRPWSPYKSCNDANLTPRSPGTEPEKMTNSEDLSRKVPNLAGQGATSNSERNWRQGPHAEGGRI